MVNPNEQDFPEDEPAETQPTNRRQRRSVPQVIKSCAHCRSKDEPRWHQVPTFVTQKPELSSIMCVPCANYLFRHAVPRPLLEPPPGKTRPLQLTVSCPQKESPERYPSRHFRRLDRQGIRGVQQEASKPEEASQISRDRVEILLGLIVYLGQLLLFRRLVGLACQAPASRPARELAKGAFPASAEICCFPHHVARFRLWRHRPWQPKLQDLQQHGGPCCTYL